MSGICSIGCKLPLGFRMRAFRFVTRNVPLPTGTREEKIAEQVGSEALIRGTAPFRGHDLSEAQSRGWTRRCSLAALRKMSTSIWRQRGSSRTEIRMSVRNQLVIIHEKEEFSTLNSPARPTALRLKAVILAAM